MLRLLVCRDKIGVSNQDDDDSCFYLAFVYGVRGYIFTYEQPIIIIQINRQMCVFGGETDVIFYSKLRSGDPGFYVC